MTDIGEGLLNLHSWARKHRIARNTTVDKQFRYITYRLGKLALLLFKQNSSKDVELELGKLLIAILVLCDCLKIPLGTLLKETYDTVRYYEGEMKNGRFDRNKS